MSIKKILLSTLGGLLLVSSTISCTSLSLGYRFADTYLESEIDDAFDPDSDQSDAISQSVDELLNWHKKEHLAIVIPKLETYLAEYEKDGLTADMMKRGEADILVEYERLFTKVVDISVPLLMTLSEKQIENYIAFGK